MVPSGLKASARICPADPSMVGPAPVVGEVPENRRALVIKARDRLAVGRDRDRFQRLAMLQRQTAGLPGRPVPQPERSVSAGRDERGTVRQ